MHPRFALLITEENLPLITVLNGGHKPWLSAENDYYLFAVDSKTSTTDHQIVSENTFLRLQRQAPDENKITLYQPQK